MIRRRAGPLVPVALALFLAGCAESRQSLVPDGWEVILAADTVEVVADLPGAVRAARARGDTVHTGATAVPHSFSPNIQLYDRDARPLDALTGLGDGPGELRARGASVDAWRDGFVVADERRLLFFDASGEFTGTLDVAQFLGRPLASRGRDWGLIGVTSDGRVLTYSSEGLFRKGTGQAGPTRKYLRSSGPEQAGIWAGGSRGRRVAPTAWETLAVLELSGYGGPLRLGGVESAHILPVRWNPLVAMERGGALVIADRTPPASDGEAASLAVVRVDGAGESEKVAELTYRPMAFPDAFLDSVLTGQFSAVSRMVGIGVGDFLAQHASQFPRPRFLSPLSAIVVGAQGTIWLGWGAHGEPTLRWLRMSPDGRPGGHVVLPATGSIVAARWDELWVEDRDDLGVPRFTRLQVAPAADDE